MTTIPSLTHRRAISVALGILLAAFVLALSGCGKKAKMVDPPQGKENDRYPQGYPNPSTDPRPGQGGSGQNGSGFSFP